MTANWKTDVELEDNKFVRRKPYGLSKMTKNWKDEKLEEIR